MAGGKKNERQRETLEEFEARIGGIAERYQDAAFGSLENKQYPTVENSDAARVRIAKEQDNNPAALKDGPSKDFVQAVNGQRQQEDPAKGISSNDKGSQQVKNSAPQHIMPAPKYAQSVDRQAHNARMAKDDKMAKQNTEKVDDRVLDAMVGVYTPPDGSRDQASNSNNAQAQFNQTTVKPDYVSDRIKELQAKQEAQDQGQDRQQGKEQEYGQG